MYSFLSDNPSARIKIAVLAVSLLSAVACGSSSPTGSNGCQVITGNTTTSFPAAGGTGTMSISATSSCTWGANSNAAFLTVTQGATGAGNGTVAFSVAANTGAARTAALTITDTNDAYADTVVTITQSAQ